MYTIGEIAKIMKLSVPTIRYYDSEGLLINVKRDSAGNRIFDDKDIDTFVLIDCLKQSGLKIKDIKKFIDLCRLGNDSLQERLEFFINQEKVILKEIQKLDKCLSLIKFKQWYYQTAIAKNDEEYVKNMNPNDYPTEPKLNFQKAHE